jgi:uroporphyrinogen-III synthase
MEFQSPEHERSYRLACKAVAHARRETYRVASAATTPQLRAWERAYRAAAPGPVTGEALTQLRMMRTIVARRCPCPEHKRMRANPRAYREA